MMPAPALPRWPPVLLLALACGCAGAGEGTGGTGPDDAGTGGGAPGRRTAAAAEVAPPAPDLGELTEDARDLMAAGDWERALETIDRGLASGPGLARHAQLSALRMRVKHELVRSSWVDARIDLDHRRVALGTPITGRILLVNRSGQGLRVPARRDGVRTTLQLDLRYREFDVNGTVRDERRQRSVLVGEEVLLAPGEHWSHPIVLDSLGFGPGRANYRRFHLRALLYPSVIHIGGEAFPGNLRFRPATCEVFPRNYEHLTAQPLKRLEEAIDKNSPPHVPLASALVPDADRHRAVGTLIRSLRGEREEPLDGPTRTACCVGLRILTGEDIAARPELWLDWSADAGR